MSYMVWKSREGFDRELMERSYTCGNAPQAEREHRTTCNPMQNSPMMIYGRIPAPSGTNDYPTSGIHNDLVLLSAIDVPDINRAATRCAVSIVLYHVRRSGGSCV